MNTLRRWNDTVSAALAWLTPLYQVLAVSLTFVLAAVFTWSMWDFAVTIERNESRNRFEYRASQIAEAVRGRMVDYEQVLHGGVGLFAASQRVERHEWRTYVEHLRIAEIYPGIQGLGYAERVPAPHKDRHQRLVRAQGFTGYVIWPPGERVEYTPIIYLEPFSDRNLRSFGYDMFSEPVRRAAMERARDSGKAVMSGKVTLVQETEQNVQAGFLMYLPVYRNTLDAGTVMQRRDALTGYVYSPFRVNDLMRGILGELRDVRLQIFDTGPGSGRALFYDSDPATAAQANPAHTVTISLPMHGRLWTLHMTSRPAFEAMDDHEAPILVGAASAVISLLVLAIIWSLATLRARAERLAREMTREMNKSREQLSLALEGSDLALFDFEVASGQVELSERWNAILGGDLRRTVTTIRELQELVHLEDVPVLQQQLLAVLKGSVQYYRVEHRVRTLNGGWRWIESNAKVTERDAKGRATRITGTNADITGRKEIERIKSEFVATVSHELRTPLTAIVGALALLREQSAGKLPAAATLFLDMAQRNSDRLSALINDILDIEKIESGLTEIRLERVVLRPFLEAAIAMNRMYAERHGVAFRLEEPVPEVAVSADRDRLLQVLTNLLSNAAKFSPHGQFVSVAAGLRGDRVRVTVSDRGAGVPKGFHGRIFQKFAQADSSDTRGKGGTGLGLSISKAIIEKMGGTIGFDSVPGQGATFYFELPPLGAAEPGSGQAAQGTPV